MGIMKHDHDVNIKIELPTQDLERLIDKVTEAALTVIGALTVSYILKRLVK